MLNQVFISYRRENEPHTARVRSLAEELRKRGLIVVFDEFYLAANPGGPDEKWSRWCINQAKESAVVIIVGSEGWYSAFSGAKSAPPGEGLGAAAEANVIQEQLYQQKWETSRHRIVLLDSDDALGLPVEISGWRRFGPLSNSADMDDLVRWAAQETGLASPSPGDTWPEQTAPLRWPVADHSEVRTAFELLVTRAAPWRFLPVQGPSETGKSHITRQMLANALLMSNLACGRFDFKGTTDMEAELRAFVQELGVGVTSDSSRLDEHLTQILKQLKQRAQPALLIFDTYEAAGKAQDWMEKQLLPSLVRAAWLRIVIAGQVVPRTAGAIWASVGRAPLQLTPPPATEWFEYSKNHRPDLTLQDVETACRLATDKPSVLAQLLGPR